MSVSGGGAPHAAIMLMKKTEIKTNARNFMFFPFSVKVKIGEHPLMGVEDKGIQILISFLMEEFMLTELLFFITTTSGKRKPQFR
jgi:hypothetical protein